MKIVVYGPEHRVGYLDGTRVIDVNGAYAKYARETQNEPLPAAMASAMAPATLQEFIEAGPRAIESTEKAVEYLKTKAQDELSPGGHQLIVSADSVRLHAPLP